MDIGNLLNDSGRSPRARSASLSDSRQMNDTKARRDVAHDRQSLASDMTSSMQPSQLPPQPAAYAPHQQYNSQYPLQAQMQPYAPMASGYASYTSPGQPLGALNSPSLVKQEGSVASTASDARTLPGIRQGSEGDVKDGALPKNFSCSTCSKQFARRSDLVRHERIHSGHRPHKCAWPLCNKQFIQRSALTVHERVHSGEKPHMCEKCSKQFSDSSSLARHRRIHSGKRPYKCPFPDCQKTFTRRTTLTRHQNNHNGTLEEAAVARAAALASHASQASVDSSEHPDHSESGSPPQYHPHQQHQQPHHLAAPSLQPQQQQQQQQQHQPPPPQPPQQQQQTHQSAYQQSHHGSQSYYPPGQAPMGQVGAPVAAVASSRSMPTGPLPAVPQYRPGMQNSFNPAPGQGQEHTQNSHAGVGPPHEGFQNYQDPRYASSYPSSFYHQQQPQQHQQHLRHPSAHEGAYDPHGQMGVGWSHSMP